MKETGLMFKAPLVRAILEGRKTQTRRIVKGVGHDNCIQVRQPGKTKTGVFSHVMDAPKLGLCPMGQPCDRLYVREAHAHHPQFAQIAFRADGEEFEDADGFLWEPKWTPAIHMKKEDARIWLEITGVRVERLQQITDTDCWAEGAITEARPDQFSVHSVIATDGKAYLSPRGAFSSLWESTGGDWAANPWVWVIDFKTISTTGLPA
ncbi:hypothetical protein [Comamonas aquatica]|uniref:Morphogenetic protein n=1 Tax=Comamonas aquatica TaxID=225991 RepID=A0AA35D624_9BURK|nr:hypothetical protein [Comamonas aquatica]CAB5676114.1 Uncharacterised protein [Comamonas aquatica]CAC9686049.1 Uncharacterised protein [Comamonas aquatica]